MATVFAYFTVGRGTDRVWVNPAHVAMVRENSGGMAVIVFAVADHNGQLVTTTTVDQPAHTVVEALEEAVALCGVCDGPVFPTHPECAAAAAVLGARAATEEADGAGVDPPARAARAQEEPGG